MKKQQARTQPHDVHSSTTAWHTQPAEAVLDRLGVDSANGLEISAARRRLEEHGPNELLDRGSKSALRIFAEQFTSLMILLLIGAAASNNLWDLNLQAPA